MGSSWRRYHPFVGSRDMGRGVGCSMPTHISPRRPNGCGPYSPFAPSLGRLSQDRLNRGRPPHPLWCGQQLDTGGARSEEQTYEFQSLMRISYAVLCLKYKTYNITTKHLHTHTSINI